MGRRIRKIFLARLPMLLYVLIFFVVKQRFSMISVSACLGFSMAVARPDEDGPW